MGQLLVGEGKEIRVIPDTPFLEAMKGLPARMTTRLAFMFADHHAVRDFVVREMPREKKPLSPALISSVTGLSGPRVTEILAELERNLFFLVRDDKGAVSWAFPMTTARTAHRLTFSTGERAFGA
jgi:hypothetical protein